LVGTAPDASYYLFITEDVTSENPVEESYWVEAAEEADRLGVDIINTSLGYFHYDNPNYNYTYNDMNGVTSFISRGAEVAFSRGMICVTSAGNSGGTSNPYISVPADAEHTLAIGAVLSNGSYASFSSIGPSSDGRIKPDVVAQGAQAVIANANGNIITANGTSFSGPITAGMVACLWQALPTKTNAEMMQIIKQSAHIYSNPTPQLGYGIPNFNTALLNNLNTFETNLDAFLVYPNPAKDLLYIKNNQSGNSIQVELISVLGIVVSKQQLTFGENTIGVSHLPSGMYFCRFSSGRIQQIKTFIKL
ncbi:MAG: T9SS type A sorting domain-containing protein, partial [Sphingobacteriales bacterium]